METQHDLLSQEIQDLIEKVIKDKDLGARHPKAVIKACQEKHKDFNTIVIERLQKKKISYVRHAESGYNAWKTKNIINMLTPYKNTVENYDPPITEKGHKQCQALIPFMDSQMNEKVELIVVSPFRRALETFGAIKEAKALSECSNIIVSCLLRERVDTPCDIGTPLTLLKESFSSYNYEFMIKENWWSHKEEYNLENRLEEKILRENKDTVKLRIALLLLWIAFRKENSILLVGHSCYYDYLASQMRFISPNIKNAEMKILPNEILVSLLKGYLSTN